MEKLQTITTAITSILDDNRVNVVQPKEAIQVLEEVQKSADALGVQEDEMQVN